MTTNYIQPGKVMLLPTATGMDSGDPFVIGNHLSMVLTGDAETASPYRAQCALEGVYDVSVKGHNGLTNQAISQGDPVYFTLGETPVLNADDSGTFFGILMEEDGVTSGATTTVAVKLKGSSVVPAATS